MTPFEKAANKNVFTRSQIHAAIAFQDAYEGRFTTGAFKDSTDITPSAPRYGGGLPIALRQTQSCQLYSKLVRTLPHGGEQVLKDFLIYDKPIGRLRRMDNVKFRQVDDALQCAAQYIEG